MSKTEFSKNQVIIIEQFYSCGADKIWTALCNPEEMRMWYFDIAEFKAEIGFKFQFVSGPTEDRQYLHVCEILEAEINKKLTHTWKYDGYEGETVVCFEMEETDGGTHLKLSHSGIESFPESNPDFARANFVEGWTWILGTALKKHLEGE